jgi:hypothetical protein
MGRHPGQIALAGTEFLTWVHAPGNCVPALLAGDRPNFSSSGGLHTINIPHVAACEKPLALMMEQWEEENDAR